MGMNLTYLILKVLIFWVQFMIGIFLTPKPCRGRAPSILISLFFEKIRKFQILCDSLEFLKILLFLTPFSLKDPTLTPPFKGTTTLFRNMRFVLDRCTVQGVWMGQHVPNDTHIDFTKLHQDHRAYAKQVI